MIQLADPEKRRPALYALINRATEAAIARGSNVAEADVGLILSHLLRDMFTGPEYNQVWNQHFTALAEIAADIYAPGPEENEQAEDEEFAGSEEPEDRPAYVLDGGGAEPAEERELTYMADGAADEPAEAEPEGAEEPAEEDRQSRKRRR